MKQKNILCIHQGYELYGSDKTFIQSIQSIKEKFPTSNITIKIPKEGPLSQELSKINVSIQYGEFYVLRKSQIKRDAVFLPIILIKNVLKSIKEINSHDVTYINSIVVIDYIIGSIFSKNKSIVHVHEIPTGITAKIFSAILRASKSKILFNSNSTKSSFSGLRGDVIYNGSPHPQELTAKPVDKINFLMIGRFNSWKGQDFFAETIAMMPKDALKNIAIKIVGGVFEDQIFFKERVEKIIAENNLSSIVSIEEFTNNTEKLYNWAHVVVVPSKLPEPFGLVATEAMSYGCAVIASNHGGLSEIVKNHETGILFEPRSHESLKSAIINYANDKDLAITHGKKGITRFIEFFSEKSYKKNIAKFFC